MRPFLLVLSSPSGAGKSTIAQHLLTAREDLGYSVSATTRKPRTGEAEGEAYHFLDRETFKAKVAAGDFLEWAEYGGQLYGTLVSEVDRVLGLGQKVVLDIEVQGARQIRARFTNSVHVFIMPPSAAELVKRLMGRKTEGSAAIVRRLGRAADELREVLDYDYAIVNDDLVNAVDHVAAILDAESYRVARREDLEGFLTTLRADLVDRQRELAAGTPAGKES